MDGWRSRKEEGRCKEMKTVVKPPVGKRAFHMRKPGLKLRIYSPFKALSKPGRQQAMVRVLGSLTELLAPGFSIAQHWLLQALKCEPADGRCLCVSHIDKTNKKGV